MNQPMHALARSCLMVLAMALAAPAAWAQAAAPVPNQAGVVSLVQGKASVAQAGAAPRALKVGDTIHEGDVLTTAKDGELHLLMQDTGFMVLRPDSQFMVMGYKADGGEDDKGVFKLLKGGVRSITGWIGRFNASAYQVRTPTATVGIRGTDHETRYIPEGSSEGEAGTYDKVYAGQTYLQTEGGGAEVSPNQAGFASDAPRERPRVLAHMPGVFRPGPHEAEIAKKHAEIQRFIDQRREERRKLIVEKLQALVAARQRLKVDFLQARAEHQLGAQALKERFNTLKLRRETLQAQAQSGALGGAPLRQQRRALVAEYVALEQDHQAFAARHKALQDLAVSAPDGQATPAADGLQSLRQELQDVREKRRDLDAERASARQEIEALQRQENQRLRHERRADRG
jgi:FtsZ-binding cell division protein ZapB